MDKVSLYSFLYKEGGSYFLYHQISRSLLEIDEELHHAVSQNNLTKIPLQTLETLKLKGFVVDDSYDESVSMQYLNLINRYQNDTLRITILPTLDCNFRCWYCYENHKPSRISSGGLNSIFLFIISEVKSRSLKKIVLDWFGGEPLLCFNNVVYPFSKRLFMWAKENNMIFHNMITTNGSLINESTALKMNEVKLNHFQITLDGCKEQHNKTRFSKHIPDSFSLIIDNIHTLCKIIENPSIELRVNYTSKNIDGLMSILPNFNNDVRMFITLSPHIVWQEAKNISLLTKKISAFKEKAIEMGYNTNSPTISTKSMACYAENMNQYVINYDMSIYKCTARDFDNRFSIGRLTAEGGFIPNNLFFTYFAKQSSFMNKECLACNVLPSCLNSNVCIQKVLEGSEKKCMKETIEKEIVRFIKYRLRK